MGLKLTSNSSARMSSIFSIAWTKITGIPGTVTGLANLANPGMIAATDLIGGFAGRTITGTANEITLTNGNGVSSNPTISLPAALTFTGKTVTGGTFAGAAISGATITTSTYNGNTWTAGTGILTLGAGKTFTASNTLTFTGTDGNSFAFPAGSDTVVTLGATQALTGKTYNGNTLTAGTWTLNGVAAKTLTFNNSLTLAGTDSTTMTFPTTSATIARTDAANTFTGHQTIEGVTSTGATGTGKFVFDTSPTLVTPTLGVATATSLNGNTFTTGTYTLTGVAGKTFTFSNTLTLSGTDASSLAIGVGGTLTGSSSSAIFFDNIPQNSQSAAYVGVLADAQKHILHPTADNNPRTFTIPSNASVAYPTGTAITFVNQINTVTIAITSDTLTQAGSGSTGSRTLAASGMATALKIASTSWMISGTGLT